MTGTSAEGFLEPYLDPYFPWFYHPSHVWTAIGYLAIFTFSGRFVIQWLHSERAKKVVVPASFWHLSFWGSLLQLVYFIHIDKAPMIFGYCFLPFIYARSLYIYYNPHKPTSTAEPHADVT